MVVIPPESSGSVLAADGVMRDDDLALLGVATDNLGIAGQRDLPVRRQRHAFRGLEHNERRHGGKPVLRAARGWEIRTEAAEFPTDVTTHPLGTQENGGLRPGWGRDTRLYYGFPFRHRTRKARRSRTDTRTCPVWSYPGAVCDGENLLPRFANYLSD
jgi:hypothetical protein